MEPKLTLPLRYYLLLTVLYSYIPAQSQKPHVGLKTGIVSSNISFKAVDPIMGSDPKLSAMFGIFLYVPVTERFSIRPALEYVSKGAYYHENFFYTNNFRRKIQFSYFDFPVNLLYAFTNGRNKLMAGGGPVVSFLMNREEDHSYASKDIGVNIMAGYELAIGASFCLNFTQGLKNIAPNKSNGGNIQNHYFGLTIGYWF